MTVGELSDRMSAPEFMEWVALDGKVEPLPDPWEQTASILCAVSNPWIAKGRKQTPLDYMPWRKKRPKRRQSAAEIMAVMAGVAARSKPPKVNG